MGSLRPHQVLHLLDEATLRCRAAEHQARDGDDQDEERRHREERVVRERGALDEGVVVAPLAGDLAQEVEYPALWHASPSLVAGVLQG